jgi:hypothetical protein
MVTGRVGLVVDRTLYYAKAGPAWGHTTFLLNAGGAAPGLLAVPDADRWGFRRRRRARADPAMVDRGRIQIRRSRNRHRRFCGIAGLDRRGVDRNDQPALSATDARHELQAELNDVC